MKSYRNYIVLLLFASLFVTACASLPKRAIPAGLVTIDNFPLAKGYLDDRYLKIKSASLLGRLKISGRGISKSFNFAGVTLWPGKFRIDTMDQLADVTSSIIISGDDLQAYFPLEGREFKGAASRENLKQLIGVALSVDDFRSIIMGLPPITRGEINLTDKGFISSGNGLIAFDRVDDKLVPTIFWMYDGKNQKKLMYRVTFSGYKVLKGVGPFPMEITVEFPRPSFEISLKYDSVLINKPVSGNLFEINGR